MPSTRSTLFLFLASTALATASNDFVMQPQSTQTAASPPRSHVFLPTSYESLAGIFAQGELLRLVHWTWLTPPGDEKTDNPSFDVVRFLHSLSLGPSGRVPQYAEEAHLGLFGGDWTALKHHVEQLNRDAPSNVAYKVRLGL